METEAIRHVSLMRAAVSNESPVIVNLYFFHFICFIYFFIFYYYYYYYYYYYFLNTLHDKNYFTNIKKLCLVWGREMEEIDMAFGGEERGVWARGQWDPLVSPKRAAALDSDREGQKRNSIICEKRRIEKGGIHINHVRFLLSEEKRMFWRGHLV